MKSATELLLQSERILISGHLRADGDCLGTESALYHLCKELGKEVVVMNPDTPDQRYERMHEHTPFEVWNPGSALPEHDLVVVCDCSIPSRLGAMGEQLAAGSAKRMVIDHHPLGEEDARFWDVLLHDETAAASGVMVMRLAQELKVKLPLPALEAAFIAIATDTGWFKYSNANAEAWQCASELVAGGVVPDELFRAIYQQSDGGHPRGVAACLAGAQLFAGGKAMLACLSRAELAASGGTLEDSDEVLDLMRSVGTVEVVAFAYEREDGVIKASLRSKEVVDVSSIAGELGGGGHHRASGITFQSEVTLDQAVTSLHKLLEGACAEAGLIQLSAVRDS